jgi:hypothetical protein
VKHIGKEVPRRYSVYWRCSVQVYRHCFFFLEGLQDWRADGYRWRQNGATKIPTKSPIMRKVHFDIQTVTGTSKAFRKFAYSFIDDDTYVVVHYVGDAIVAEDFPHGSLTIFKHSIQKLLGRQPLPNITSFAVTKLRSTVYCLMLIELHMKLKYYL